MKTIQFIPIEWFQTAPVGTRLYGFPVQVRTDAERRIGPADRRVSLIDILKASR